MAEFDKTMSLWGEAQQAIAARQPSHVALLLEMPLDAVSLLMANPDEWEEDDKELFVQAYVYVSAILINRGASEDEAFNLTDAIAGAR